MCRKVFLLVSLVLILTGSASAALIAQYKFENTGDGYVHPTVGTVIGSRRGGAAFNSDPSIIGTGTITTGPYSHVFGEVIGFYGNDEYVKIGNTDVGNALVASNAMTLGAWVRSDGSNWGDAGIITKGYNWRIFWTGSNYGKVQVMNTAPTATLSGSKAIGDSSWHHIAGTWDGSYYKLYIDGHLDATSGLATGAIVNTASHKFHLGGWESGGTIKRWYDGYLDDVRIYSDVQTLYQIRKWAGIPEPATIALLGLGGLLLRRRK